MRQTAAERSYVGSRAAPLHCSSAPCHGIVRWHGFTLIEVVVAIGILSVVILAVFMLVTVSAASFKDSEMRDTATNIANYTVEYVRSRNVTSDNSLGKALTGDFPGLIDLGGDAVNNKPVGSIVSATALSINNSPDTLYSSLQGYVSLAGYPTNAALSSEDSNAKVLNGKYCDRITEAPYVVRFPLVSGASGIKSFTALTGYNAKIYTSDTDKSTNTSSPKYDPHYTGTKTNTMAYTGFRVLTQIVARSSSTHVQYYDVRVTVFWVLGNAEHSYSVATQITTYGGS